jgi:hypothetical protein
MQEQITALIVALIFLLISLYLVIQNIPWLSRLLKRTGKFLWKSTTKSIIKREPGRGATRFERE